MQLLTNKRLFDIATRYQIYIEGIKLQFAKGFDVTLRELELELDVLLARTKYKTLDGLSKAKLNKLIITLRNSQYKIYSRYTKRLINKLMAFICINKEVSRIVYASAIKNRKVSDKEAKDIISKTNVSEWESYLGIESALDNDRHLWWAVKKTPIAANGMTLENFIAAFSIASRSSVENLISKAWVNGWTVEETISALTGESPHSVASQLQKVQLQNRAVINTLIQHAAAISTAAVASIFFREYRWCSVIDSRTSDICAERNGKTYKYGAGPMPPAHINCRSHICPVVGNSDIINSSFVAWYASQPDEVKEDIKLTEKGGLIAEPLTFDEFKSKIDLILQR